MNVVKFLVAFSFCFAAVFSSAQNENIDIPNSNDTIIVVDSTTENIKAEIDSTHITEVKWFRLNQIVGPFKPSPSYIDTTLIAFQIYDFAQSDDEMFLAQKGNIGHASRNLVFNPSPDNEFSLFLYNNHFGYNLSNSQLKYIRPNHVASELFYVFGTNREQVFFAKHAQKVNDKTYFGFGYNVISSPGKYSRLNARNNSLYGIVDYSGNKYQLVSSASYGKIMNQESGGLKNRLGFEQDEVRDSVFLFNAQYKNYDLEAKLNHYYKLGFNYKVDSGKNINDSIVHEKEERTFNFGRLGHEALFQRKVFVFEENSGVYPFLDVTPFNRNATYDSTVVRLLHNELSWSNFPVETKNMLFPINFKLFIKHQYINLKFPFLALPRIENEEGELSYPFNQWHYNQYIPGIEIHSDMSKLFSFSANAEYTILGYNDEDLFMKAGLNIGGYNGKHRVMINALYNERRPPYFFQYYMGNYQRWESKFEKMQITNASVKYLYNGFELEGNYFILNNMVFLGEDVLPYQNSSTFDAFNINLKTDHNFWGFGLRNNIVFQYVPNNEFEDYPELLSYHSIYYGNKLFKKVMDFQFGFDFYYNSAYFPSAYMPVVFQFYKQNEYKSDELFLLDVFLNVKVSDVRVFLKYQNILGLIMNNSPQYQIPFYPLPETMLKFGVSWMFFN
jgi:hypothetical protein